jgi:hypothetical protein
MDKRTKTWLSIVVAILAVVAMLGAAAIGGSIFFVYSHVRQAHVEDKQAGDRFAEVRQKMGGRQPLLEIRDREQVVVNRAATSQGVAVARPEVLRAIVYDSRDGRIVDVDIPFWLLRIMPSGRFSFVNDAGLDFDSERIHVTVEDLEEHGPGLILDHRTQRGGEILVWTE